VTEFLNLPDLQTTGKNRDGLTKSMAHKQAEAWLKYEDITECTENMKSNR
jgi:hypothetical protein